MRRSKSLGWSPHAAAVLVILGANPGPLLGQLESAALDTIIPRIEQWTRAVLDTSGVPAISIALVRDRKVVWAEAYGHANVAGGVEATPETYFSTGSTFKFVTAAAVMQLVERGLVTLDTPLNSIVGDSAGIPGAGDVTLRHLLTHYSGLTGPARRVELWSREAVLSSAELLATLTRAGPPGTEYRYCNACYGVLGYVVEVLTGETYGEYVAEHLLAPLGIQVNSATVPEPRIVEHMALPYNVEDGVPTPVPQVRFAGPAAGDVYLTPSQMARFLAAMLSGGVYDGTRVLNASSVSEMETAQFGSRGLGISVGDFNGHQILIHNGSIPGFKAVLIGDPVTGDGVYVAANANQGERPINLLARYVMLLLWNESFVPPSGQSSSSRH